jgi:hypothetical protein
MARTIDQILQNWQQYGTVEGPDVKVLVDTVIRQRNAGREQARKVEEMKEFLDKRTKEMKAEIDREVKAAIKKMTAAQKKETRNVGSGEPGDLSAGRRKSED